MAELGLVLLALVGVAIVATGLPAFAMLIGGAVAGAFAILVTGSVPTALLAALPGRLLSLLESDLLQALPLYVLVGVMLDRLGIAQVIVRVVVAALGGGPRPTAAAAMVVGTLLGPMNGSVGASVLAVARSVDPELARAGVSPEDRQALTAVAGTLGVVTPPSLVLILFGDAMLAAHTIASTAMHRTERIINTQDVFRGALLPAALFVVLATLAAAWRARGTASAADAREAARLDWRDTTLALGSAGAVVVLLGLVLSGRIYAVEGAATAAVLLFLGGLVSGRIRIGDLGALLDEALQASGTIFAPLVAATTFTLVLRLLGTDRLLSDLITGVPGGEVAVLVIALVLFAASALVLDAFEIVFVVVPIVMPPLLMRVPDALWVAVLVLLTLQLSFLLPPVGYALVLSGRMLGLAVPLVRQFKAVAPFVVVQIAVLGLVLALPALVHVADPPTPAARPAVPAQPIAIPAPAFGARPFGGP